LENIIPRTFRPLRVNLDCQKKGLDKITIKGPIEDFKVEADKFEYNKEEKTLDCYFQKAGGQIEISSVANIFHQKKSFRITVL
jgi:hypothetical protein